MTAAEIRQLREELSCSVGELADALEVSVPTVLAWEAGDEFPTKRHVTRLSALRSGGAATFPRKKRKGRAPSSPNEALRDPRLWTIFRKLLAHPELFAEVDRLAARYDDPSDP
jgi:transcriptional regulator with XRE-family HTH domain